MKDFYRLIPILFLAPLLLTMGCASQEDGTALAAGVNAMGDEHGKMLDSFAAVVNRSTGDQAAKDAILAEISASRQRIAAIRGALILTITKLLAVDYNALLQEALTMATDRGLIPAVQPPPDPIP